MSRLVVAAVACAALFAAHQSAAAGPPAPGPDGATCGVLLSRDELTGPDVYSGVLLGGPLAGDGTLTCSVQLGAVTHSGPDSAAASGTSGVVLAPVSVEAPPHVAVYVCTEFRPAAGASLYWHPATGDEPGHWTTDANAPCGPATSARVSETIDPLAPLIYIILELLDPCPVMAIVLPPHGDIPAIGWDCPPYSPTDPGERTDAGVIVRAPDV